MNAKKIRLVVIAAIVAVVVFNVLKSTKDAGDELSPAVRPVRDGNLKSVAFVFDNSMSMNEKIGGVTKMDSAKKSFAAMLEKFGEHQKDFGDLEGGFYCFSDDGEARTLAPMGAFDHAVMKGQIESLDFEDGGTPIGRAILKAEAELDARGHGEKFIILMTDGENNVGIGPEEAYKLVAARPAKTKLFIVAFNTSASRFDGLRQMGADVKDPRNGEELMDMFAVNAEAILAEAPLDPNRPAATEPAK